MRHQGLWLTAGVSVLVYPSGFLTFYLPLRDLCRDLGSSLRGTLHQSSSRRWHSDSSFLLCLAEVWDLMAQKKVFPYSFPPSQDPETSTMSLLQHFSAEWELPPTRKGTWHQLVYNPTAGKAKEMLQCSFRTTELNRHRQGIWRYRHSRSIRQKAVSGKIQETANTTADFGSSNIWNGQINYDIGESITSITSNQTNQTAMLTHIPLLRRKAEGLSCSLHHFSCSCFILRTLWSKKFPQFIFFLRQN